MTQSARARKRILWVDDEIDLLKPHLLFLQARNYHVDAISNGDDALELMREAPYDLVLLDEQMPRQPPDLFSPPRQQHASPMACEPDDAPLFSRAEPAGTGFTDDAFNLGRPCRSTAPTVYAASGLSQSVQRERRV
mgnify:CR=1 FL=1